MARAAAGRRAILFAVLFAIAFAAPPAAVTIRNRVVGGDWVVVASQGGVNFYIGNNPAAIGTFAPPKLYPNVRLDHPAAMREAYERYAEEQVGRELSPAGVSAPTEDRHDQ